ncbi:hypothetical protein CKAN_02309300 [Cinnamomum micranthum f. kanehirae]|uniref:Uncharacterized protein n=1 Tax=Cinnamomum micranthum f. kanehirae TaxID=337451 RepID=A0A3S3NT57_9MAGN|nr:hypothetical protein CKAN_02309300 [Cinnamomum micranthum f. kanehirae]
MACFANFVRSLKTQTEFVRFLKDVPFPQTCFEVNGVDGDGSSPSPETCVDGDGSANRGSPAETCYLISGRSGDGILSGSPKISYCSSPKSPGFFGENDLGPCLIFQGKGKAPILGERKEGQLCVEEKTQNCPGQNRSYQFWLQLACSKTDQENKFVLLNLHSILNFGKSDSLFDGPNRSMSRVLPLVHLCKRKGPEASAEQSEAVGSRSGTCLA